MTEKNEALRLADALWALMSTVSSNGVLEAAAAELRRLHEAHDWQYRMAGERLRRVEKLGAQRDALLEALKRIVAMWDHRCYAHGDGVPTPLHAKARAAIAKAEENT